MDLKYVMHINFIVVTTHVYVFVGHGDKVSIDLIDVFLVV